MQQDLEQPLPPFIARRHAIEPTPRQRWQRSLIQAHLCKDVIWWMFVAILLISFDHSTSSSLTLWFNVLTTLVLCHLATREVLKIVILVPPPRGVLHVVITVEVIAIAANIAQLVVRGIMFSNCRRGFENDWQRHADSTSPPHNTSSSHGDNDDNRFSCDTYPERSIAITHFLLVAFVLAFHVLALISAIMVLRTMRGEEHHHRHKRDTRQSEFSPAPPPQQQQQQVASPNFPAVAPPPPPMFASQQTHGSASFPSAGAQFKSPLASQTGGSSIGSGSGFVRKGMY